MTREEAREHLKNISRASSGNPGYVEALSDLEIDGWIAFFEALKLLSDDPAA